MVNNYETRRAWFIRTTIACFEFLVHDFNFDTPVHRTAMFTHSDGNIFPITDFIAYSRRDITVEIRNEYPPHGQGLTVEVLPRTGTTLPGMTHRASNEQNTAEGHIHTAAVLIREYLILLPFSK